MAVVPSADDVKRNTPVVVTIKDQEIWLLAPVLFEKSVVFDAGVQSSIATRTLISISPVMSSAVASGTDK